jgi:hypothetical protein
MSSHKINASPHAHTAHPASDQSGDPVAAAVAALVAEVAADLQATSPASDPPSAELAPPAKVVALPTPPTNPFPVAVSALTSGMSLAGSAPAQSINKRTHTRYLVRWRVAVVYESGAGKRTFHGRVNDISLGGLSIHCDYNIFHEGKVIVLLALPPLNAGAKEKVLEISSRMHYTILSQKMFRIGMEFLDFRTGDKRLLEERLEISNAAGMAYLE